MSGWVERSGSAPAGNFGQSLEVEQAVRIGLLPDIPREHKHFIGNGNQAGARAAVLSHADWKCGGALLAAHRPDPVSIIHHLRRNR